MTMKQTNQCYLRWLISVSVKNQYQHLYQLGTVPKNLSVPLHAANGTEKPFCTVDLITLNGTERFFSTIGCIDLIMLNGTQRFFGTVGHMQWYRKVFWYCWLHATVQKGFLVPFLTNTDADTDF